MKDLVLYHMFNYCLYKSLHDGSHLGNMCIKVAVKYAHWAQLVINPTD